MSETHYVIRNNRAICISIEPERSSVYTRPINPATGKPWQSWRYIAQFEGPLHKNKGMVAWLKACRAAKGE